MNKGTSSKREVTVEGAEGNEDKLHSLKCVACGGTDRLHLGHPCLEFEEYHGRLYSDVIDWDSYTNHVERKYKDTGLKYDMIRHLAGRHEPLLDLVVCRGCSGSGMIENYESYWEESGKHWDWESYGLREKYQTMRIERWRKGLARREKARKELG